MKQVIKFGVPILFLGIVLFYNPNPVFNQRTAPEVESKLVERQDEFELVSRENIEELETETLIETNVENPKTLELDDTVRVHYRGWRANDAGIFDSSFDSEVGAEFPFREGGLIDGWTQALAGRKEGEVVRIFIPSDLAYGEEGSGTEGTDRYIPPNTDLIFDVEILAIQ